ncbi:MAG: Pr6Pr family membrane protein [Candidatus Nanopelagicales bacterium]|nr:Pr6Pr family membrane protein [Candidatus Nanopelagicales bacterium]
MTLPAPAPVSSTGRIFFGINAASAWLGLAVSLVLTVFAVYPNTETVTTIVGFNQPGLAGLPGRVFDYMGYFTQLSNLVVAIVMTLLWRNSARTSRLFAVLRLDSLIMITVTGLVFAIVLAPNADLVGWQYVSNSLLHYITPPLTVLVFILFGPRGMVRPRNVLPALILPVAWIGFALVRGAVIGAYPYGFIDVAVHGYGTVMVNIAGIFVLGVLIGLLFCGIEALMRRASSRH